MGHWCFESESEDTWMKIRVTEIEADARELRESNTLAQNFYSIRNRCLQNAEPLDDEEPEEEE